MRLKLRTTLIFCLLLGAIQPARAFTLSSESAKDCAIVVSPDPTPAARLASLELRHHLAQILGAELPILAADAAALPEKLILVGASSLSAAMDIDPEELGPQEYLIDVRDSRIVLLGRDWTATAENRREEGISTGYRRLAATRAEIDYGAAVGREASGGRIELPGHFDPQGSLYAVYDFLERFCAVRWYGPDPRNAIIPPSDSLAIAPTRILRAPDMKHRDGTDTFRWPMMKQQWFDADDDKIKLYLRRIRFGGEKWAANHSLADYYRRFKAASGPGGQDSPLFEQDRPDFFAQGYNTGRGARQLCYTNPDLVAQVAADARRYFDGGGLVGQQPALGRYFAVVPMDNQQWCQCERCQSMIARDKDNRRGNHFNSGTASHYLFYFVNSVAREVHKTHPDRMIACLAYHVYAFKPEIELMPNVSVAPCLQTRNYWAPRIRESEMKFYKEWVAEQDRPIYLWNYACFPTERGMLQGFNVFPGFNIHNQAELIKTFVRDGVRGIFLCGIGEQLDFYATYKLYDDSSLAIDQVLDEFFNLYFGEKSGAMMKRFYTRIESVYSSPESYPDYIRERDEQYHQTAQIAWEVLGTPELMEELGDYIRRAYECAETELQRERIASWDNGVWQYMLAGRKKYYENRNQ
jgi:hypothetical protein